MEATERTGDIDKWFGFQDTWSDKQKTAQWIGGKIPSEMGYNITDKKRALASEDKCYHI